MVNFGNLIFTIDHPQLTKLLNEEQEDKRSVAKDVDSSTKAGCMTKITFQKPNFVNINEA